MGRGSSRGVPPPMQKIRLTPKADADCKPFRGLTWRGPQVGAGVAETATQLAPFRRPDFSDLVAARFGGWNDAVWHSEIFFFLWEGGEDSHVEIAGARG